MKMQVKGALIATAVAGMFLAKGALAQGYRNAEELAAKVHCQGVNECKGKGSCKSEGNACSGKNECKGKGWIAMSAEECKTKGGTVK